MLAGTCERRQTTQAHLRSPLMSQPPDSESPPVVVLDRFLRQAKTLGKDVKSPAGKLLARRFSLSNEGLVAATIYPVSDRRLIVQQLRLALVSFYVHLDRKKSIYGFDPVRALDLLEGTCETITDAEFHQSVAELIVRTRDRHLSFMGRAPIGTQAVLPFTIERCWDGDDLHYIVSRIESEFTPDRLSVGARVTHWNGIPIDRYVRLNANIFDGG